MGALVVTIVASALACIFPALMPITSSSYSGLLAVAAIFGLLLAAIPSVTSSLLVDLLGIKHLNNSFGVLTFVRGVAVGEKGEGEQEAGVHRNLVKYSHNFLYIQTS